MYHPLDIVTWSFQFFKSDYLLSSNSFWDVFSVLQNAHRETCYAKSLQSCPTLCNPIDSPPVSHIPGILQARTLEWVAISFSNAWKWKVKVKLLSRIRLLATPWTSAYQAPPSMGFSRQEYWSGVPLPSPIEKHSLSNFDRRIHVWKHYLILIRFSFPHPESFIITLCSQIPIKPFDQIKTYNFYLCGLLWPVIGHHMNRIIKHILFVTSYLCLEIFLRFIFLK